MESRNPLPDFYKGIAEEAAEDRSKYIKDAQKREQEAKEFIEKDTNYARKPFYQMYLERFPDDPYKYTSALAGVTLAEGTQFGTGTLAVDAQQAFERGQPVLGTTLSGLTYLSAGAPFLAKPLSVVAKKIARRNKVEELLGEEGEVLDVVRTDPPDMVTPPVEKAPVVKPAKPKPFSQKFVGYDETLDESVQGVRAVTNLVERGQPFPLGSPRNTNIGTNNILAHPTEVLGVAYSGVTNQLRNLDRRMLAQLGYGKDIEVKVDNATGEKTPYIKASNLVRFFDKLTDPKIGALEQDEVQYLINKKLLNDQFGIKVINTVDKKGRRMKAVKEEDDQLLNLNTLKTTYEDEVVKKGFADFTFQRDKQGFTTSQPEFSSYRGYAGQTQSLLYPEIGYEAVTFNSKNLPQNVIERAKHGFRGDALGHARFSVRDITKDAVKKATKDVLKNDRIHEEFQTKFAADNLNDFMDTLTNFKQRMSALRTSPTIGPFTPNILDSDSLDTVREKVMQTQFNEIMYATPPATSVLKRYEDPVTGFGMYSYREGLMNYLRDKAAANAERAKAFIPSQRMTAEQQEFAAKYGLDADTEDDFSISATTYNLDTGVSSFTDYRVQDLLKMLHDNEAFQKLANHKNFKYHNTGLKEISDEDKYTNYPSLGIMFDDPNNYDRSLLSTYSIKDPLYIGDEDAVFRQDGVKKVMTNYGLSKDLMKYIIKQDDLGDALKVRRIQETDEGMPPEGYTLEQMNDYNFQNRDAIEVREELIANMLDNFDDNPLFNKANGNPIFSGYGIDDVEDALDEIQAALEFVEKDFPIIRLSSKEMESLEKLEDQLEKRGINLDKKFLHDYRFFEAHRDPKNIDSSLSAIINFDSYNLQARLKLLRKAARHTGKMRKTPDGDLVYDIGNDVALFADNRDAFDALPQRQKKPILEGIQALRAKRFHNEILSDLIDYRVKNFNSIDNVVHRQNFANGDLLKKRVKLAEDQKAFLGEDQANPTEQTKFLKQQALDDFYKIIDEKTRPTYGNALTFSQDDVDKFVKDPESYVNKPFDRTRTGFDERGNVYDVYQGILEDVIDNDKTSLNFMARVVTTDDMIDLQDARSGLTKAWDKLVLKSLDIDDPKTPLIDFKSPIRFLERESREHERFQDLLKNMDTEEEMAQRGRFSSDFKVTGDYENDKNKITVFEQIFVEGLERDKNVPTSKGIELIPFIRKFKYAKDRYDDFLKSMAQATKDDLLKTKFIEKYSEADIDNFINRSIQPFNEIKEEGKDTANLFASPINISKLTTEQLRSVRGGQINYDNPEFLSDKAPENSPNKIKFTNNQSVDYMVNDIRDFLNTHDFGKDVDAFGVPLEDKYRSTIFARDDTTNVLDRVLLSQDLDANYARPDSGYMNIMDLRTARGKPYFLNRGRVRRNESRNERRGIDVNPSLTFGELSTIGDDIRDLKEAYSQSPIANMRRKLEELSRSGGDIDSKVLVLDELQSDIHNDMFRRSGGATVKEGDAPLGEGHDAYVRRLLTAAIILAKQKGINKIVIPNYKKQRQARGRMSEDIIQRAYKNGVERALRYFKQETEGRIKTYKTNELLYTTSGNETGKLDDIASGDIIDLEGFTFDPKKGDVFRYNEGGLAA